MTDDDLLRRLGEKEAQDFSAEEVSAIRKRLLASRPLRDAISDRLSLEQGLGEVVGRATVSVDDLLRRAGEVARQARRASRIAAALAASIITCVGLAVYLSPPPERAAAVEEARIEPSTRAIVPVEGPATQPPPPPAQLAGDEAAAPRAEDSPPPAAPVVAPVATEELLPAALALEYGGEEKPFAEVCFDDFDGERSFPSKSDLERWLSPAGEERSEIADREEGGSRRARFDGLYELKVGSAWELRSVLRLSVFGSRGLQIHLWRAEEGATLELWPKAGAWAAYRTTRSGSHPRPDSLELAATDAGRWRTSGEGTFELRQQDGLLVLSRGDLLLLAVPFPGAIERVYFDGRATVRGIAIYRGAPFPLAKLDPSPARRAIERPAEVEWKTSLADGAKLERAADGSIALSASGAKRASWASVSIGGEKTDGEEASSAEFEVEGAAPGTGVYLGDPEGRPVQSVGFFEARRGALVLGFSKPDDSRTKLEVDEEKGPVAYAGARARIRLSAESGAVRCSVSPDGIRWSEALAPLEIPRGAAAPRRLGIYCARGDGARRIVLRRVVLPGALSTAADEARIAGATVAGRSETALRAEILDLVYRGAWDGARSLAQRIAFFNRPSDPSSRLPRDRARLLALAEWADALAWKRSPRRGSSGGAADPALQQPLLEEVSKEGFNILAEFDAALASQSYRDACEIIVSARTQTVSGLVPDSKEPDLLVSLSGAVALAMQDHPGLARTMRGDFGALGRLRLREALALEDAAAVEAVSLQFCGTEAAGEASLWTGDRCLAAGDFARAASQYRQALATCAPASRGSATARLRLASAYLGQEVNGPVPGAVELGGVLLSSRDLDALSRDVAPARERGGQPTTPRTPRTSRAGHDGESPPPASLRSRTWARVERSMEHGPSGVPDEASGWLRRQLALASDAGLRILSDRSQIVAWDASTGERKWSEVLKEDSGRWPFVEMMPTIFPPRVFVRRMAVSGPELIALDASSGKVLWRARPGHHVASDPLIVRDQLLAMTVTAGEEGVLELYLTAIDPTAGAVISRGLVARFRDVWDRQIPCRAAAIDDRIVVSAGGAVICCDALGQPLWLRRQPLLFPRQDSEWFEEEHAPPLAAGSRLIVSQPGFRCIECLELRSGRLEWRRVLPRLKKIAGLAGERVVVATDGELLSLRVADGEPAWRVEAPRLVDVPLCGGAGGIVYECLEGNGPPWPCVVWLDADSGREVRRAPLRELSNESPSLGPIESLGGRLWSVFAPRGSKELEVVELVPQGK